MPRDLQVLPLPLTPPNVARFLQVSYAIYRDDPLWVAPLLADLKLVFTPRNPLFAHAEMALWVARRDGRDVGRIAGVLDHSYNEVQHDNAGFFGFFECVNDAAVSRALFAAVAAWARERGLRRLVGPMNPTSNDECGLLVEGFDRSPVFMMTYNPRYYLDLVAAEGFTKAKDLIAFYFDLANSPTARLQRIAAKARARSPELTFRPVRRKTLADDLTRIKEVYNAAWERNWGFVPMTDAEINFMAARLKPLLMEGIIWLAECGGEAVGFLLALPDFNLPLKPLRGRLLTPRLLGFLPYLLRWKVPAAVRVITLGVKEGYRGRGIESVMLAEGLKVGFAAGFQACEASWVLEDNVNMRRVIELFGARPYKTYRLYQKDL